jgi:hypothetical protein
MVKATDRSGATARAGVLRAHLGHTLGGDAFGQRTARFHVGDQHGFRRVQDFRGLGHEMHAALHDHIGLNLGRLDRQLQAVAHEIGDAVIDVGRHVVMRKDDRVTLFFQLVDRGDIGGVNGPIGGRNDTVHLGVDIGHFSRQRWRWREVIVALKLAGRKDFITHGRSPSGLGACHGTALDTTPGVLAIDDWQGLGKPIPFMTGRSAFVDQVNLRNNRV